MRSGGGRRAGRACRRAAARSTRSRRRCARSRTIAEFNAGYGAVLTRAATVEVDALRHDRRAAPIGAVGGGAVAAPSGDAGAARARGRRARAAGRRRRAGVRARARHRSRSRRDTMVSPRARKRFERHEGEAKKRMRTGDTVGACAIDGDGRVAAATSTGGIPWKRPGRVGDTPLPGAGTWAEDGIGAASATGHGESIIRALMTRFAIDRLRAGAAPDERGARGRRRARARGRRGRRHPRRRRRQRRACTRRRRACRGPRSSDGGAAAHRPERSRR